MRSNSILNKNTELLWNMVIKQSYQDKNTFIRAQTNLIHFPIMGPLSLHFL